MSTRCGGGRDAGEAISALEPMLGIHTFVVLVSDGERFWIRCQETLLSDDGG